MPKYGVEAIVERRYILEVEADSEDDAQSLVIDKYYQDGFEGEICEDESLIEDMDAWPADES